MADKSIIDRLKAVLIATPATGEAKAAPQMGGMVGEAQKTLKNAPYLKHVEEYKAMGMVPLTPEQFANTH